MSEVVDSSGEQADPVYGLLGLHPGNGQAKVMSKHCGAVEIPD